MKQHIENFRRWLKLLNFAESTIYSNPRYIKNFTDYLEATGIKTIQDIENRHIKEYYEYLKVRPNKRKPGALSQHAIINHIGALKRFAKYIRESGQGEITVNIKPERIKPEIKILSTEEIQILYKVCGNDILGYRDRAMLSIYYGCGLRRTEGIQLNTEDIIFNKSMIFIKKGKGNRQRYIPMNRQVKNDLENYINNARIYLIKSGKENEVRPLTEALFLSQRSKRISGNATILRLKQLLIKSEISKEKIISTGLHTLRHSIATHLLNSGMNLENVSRFLGLFL
ncbi:MAG: Tyrosine recombinase XerA [Candidatus Methanophagaceae archaeon]|nr:MAG: Tyrosine recombinase XerA [Methanophagales archaeon]